MSILNKYRIWGTQGQGPSKYPDTEFLTLDEAIEFVDMNYGESCFRIEQPDGTDYKWPEDDSSTYVLGFKLKEDESDFNRRQKYYLKKLQLRDSVIKNVLVDDFRRRLLPVSTMASCLCEFRSMPEDKAREFVWEMIEWDMFDMYQIIPWSGRSGIKLGPIKMENW